MYGTQLCHLLKILVDLKQICLIFKRVQKYHVFVLHRYTVSVMGLLLNLAKLSSTLLFIYT